MPPSRELHCSHFHVLEILQGNRLSCQDLEEILVLGLKAELLLVVDVDLLEGRGHGLLQSRVAVDLAARLLAVVGGALSDARAVLLLFPPYGKLYLQKREVRRLETKARLGLKLHSRRRVGRGHHDGDEGHGANQGHSGHGSHPAHSQTHVKWGRGDAHVCCTEK
eukprot:1871175-Rhodomonas_salina.4